MQLCGAHWGHVGRVAVVVGERLYHYRQLWQRSGVYSQLIHIKSWISSPNVRSYAARKNGDTLAVVDGDRLYNYRQLWQRSGAAARHLRADCGVLRGGRVAVMLRNCAEVGCIAST